jgi:hypothetical protein
VVVTTPGSECGTSCTTIVPDADVGATTIDELSFVVLSHATRTPAARTTTIIFFIMLPLLEP